MPVCPQCQQGRIRKKRIYRLGPVGAVFGYLFLLPSLVVLFWGISLIRVATDDPPDRSAELEAQFREELATEAHLPPDVIEKVVADTLTEEEYAALTEEQKTDLRRERNDHSYRSAPSAVGPGFGILMGAMLAGVAFFGCLIGIVLSLRKKVFRCEVCRATMSREALRMAPPPVPGV